MTQVERDPNYQDGNQDNQAYIVGSENLPIVYGDTSLSSLQEPAPLEDMRFDIVPHPKEIDQIEFRQFIRATGVAGKVMRYARLQRNKLPHPSYAEGRTHVDPGYEIDFDDLFEQYARDLEYLQGRLDGNPAHYASFVAAVKAVSNYCLKKGINLDVD